MARARPSAGALISLVRAPAALSVPGDVVAGAAAAGVLGPCTAGLAAAATCLYWSGMAANDWADRSRDAVERPERPIPSGRVTPGQALGVAAGLTVAGLALAAGTGGRGGLLSALPLAAAVWAYDLVLKQTPAGPAAMAACRGLDVLMGASGGRPARALPAALTVAAHTYGVTALSRREVTGSGRALPAATLAGTAAVALAAALHPARRPAAGLLAAWYAAACGRDQVRALADPCAGRVRAAVGSGITGLPVLQGALAAGAGATGAGLAVAALAPAARGLARTVSPT